MRYSISLLFLFLICSDVQSQAIKKKGDSCSCNAVIHLEIPSNSGEDTLSATVIIEMDIDSNCIYSNPVLVQSASPAMNKSAMNYAMQYISAQNKCRAKCKFLNCNKSKKRLPVSFEIDSVD